jgi:2-iminobutanoate/2-iminopropanoate deaminase
MADSPDQRKWPVRLPDGLLHSHGAYSAGIVCGQLLFVSGQVGVDPRTDGLVADEIGAQTRRALENLLLVAASADAGPQDAVRIGVHLADMADFAVFDGIYREYFGDPYPTRVTVQATLFPGFLIEIDGIFALSPAPSPREPSEAASTAQ